MDASSARLIRIIAAAAVVVVATGAAVASFVWQGQQHVFVSIYFGVIVGLLVRWVSLALLRMARVPRRRVDEGRGLRNPVDAVGLWYRDLPTWRQVGLALIAPQVVVSWWVVYQFRRGWFGPPVETAA